ncbi:MAG TPA: thioredoxin fold domain-containing protein [Sedimentisphaerales bacterium]|nr:thioredoxin fold domain-containing protein [Sedimentisphaerales bacterium]
MIGLEKLRDVGRKCRPRIGAAKIPGLSETNTPRRLPRLFLFGFAGLVLCGAAVCFWPTIKGSRQAPIAVVLTKGNVTLSGILYAEDKPSALVNGKIAYEGDVIEGVKVVQILKDKVEFESSGVRWSQSLPDMKEGISSALPRLLQLGSHKCPACAQMTPILNELKNSHSGKFQITFIDVWQDRAAGARYGVGAIPTQIFYDSQGRELFRHVGFYSKDDILAAWSKLGVNL